MRCAVNFLTVVGLTTSVGLAAFFIIFHTKEKSCDENEWKCVEKEDICIKKSQRCNGVKECPKGSDEDVLLCNDLKHTLQILLRMWRCGKTLSGSNETNTNTTTALLENPDEIIEGLGEAEAELEPIITTLDDLEENLETTKLQGSTTLRITTPLSLPWDKISENATIWTVEGALNLTNLRQELVPPVDMRARIHKLFVENNILTTLESGSICGWKDACWLSLSDNFIQNIKQGAFCPLKKLHFLALSNNSITLKDYKFPYFPKLQDLLLDNNQIEDIDDSVFRSLKELVSLNLLNNKIRYISSRAFRYNVKLKDLDLTGNMLKRLHPEVFQGQALLEKLYLANNPFHDIPGEAIRSLKRIESLNLEGITYTAIDFDALENSSSLKYLRFKKFAYCKNVPKVALCFPYTDGMSTIHNLFEQEQIRWIVWIVSALTTAGNSIVLVTRCLFGGRGRILDVFINNLAAADFLMGMYLVIVALKDIEYRDIYHNNAYIWSSSLLCSSLGIVAMISCEVSLLVLTFLSVERYLVISNPFSYHKKLSLNMARISMLIIWVFVTVLAVAPAITWRDKFSFYGSSGLCFPVHLDERFPIGWQYTAFVFVGLNSLCLIVVAISYSKLFFVIKQTRMSTPVEKRDVEMAIRLFLMVFTDCMCWLPIILLKILVLAGYQIRKDLITWVVIFVLPINSTINPYLYTLSMPETRMKLLRRIIPSRILTESFLNLVTFRFLRRKPATIRAAEDGLVGPNCTCTPTWGDPQGDNDNTSATLMTTTNSNGYSTSTGAGNGNEGTISGSERKRRIMMMANGHGTSSSINGGVGRLSYQESVASSKLEDAL